MYKHHSLEEKKEIIRMHEAGACMVELMNRFHVRDHYLYILFGRYEKYGIDGLERYKRKRITAKLKKSVIEEYEKDILPDLREIRHQLHECLPLGAAVQARRLRRVVTQQFTRTTTERYGTTQEERATDGIRTASGACSLA